MNLNERQKAFADYYIETGNQMEAARRAGYKNPHANASRIMANDGVQAYIKERMHPTAERRIATADDVMEFLSKGMRGEIKDQFGLDPSFQDRISCAKELMKRYSAIQDKAESTEARIIIQPDGGIEVEDGT